LAYSNFGRTSAVIVHKALPYLGFVPDDLGSTPSRVEYGDREHTRTDHLREIQDRLGFLDTRPADSAALGSPHDDIA
jgi:hypothetical protein